MINTKEQTIINSINDTFEGENIQTQYSVLGYWIDLYFHEYKLTIEVDELGHTNRNINNEIERQKALKKELNCIFIRINPDKKDFNIFKEINKIHRHIKKFLIGKIQVKSLNNNKAIKKVVKKHFTKLEKMKNTQSKIKSIKNGKQPGTTYCFGCKDHTKSFRPEKVKITNKVLREKSHCVVRWSNKSRFLNNK